MHGGPATRKKRVVLAVCAVLVILLLVSLWRWHARNVNSVLAGAGFACLPESAKDVMMDRQGGIMDVRVTFIKFTTSQDDVLSFLQDSGIHTPGSPLGEGSGVILGGGSIGRLKSMLRRVLRSGQRVIPYPSWWIRDWRNPGLLRYRRVPDRDSQTAIVDCITCTVYIQLWHL